MILLEHSDISERSDDSVYRRLRQIRDFGYLGYRQTTSGPRKAVQNERHLLNRLCTGLACGEAFFFRIYDGKFHWLLVVIVGNVAARFTAFQ